MWYSILSQPVFQVVAFGALAFLLLLGSFKWAPKPDSCTPGALTVAPYPFMLGMLCVIAALFATAGPQR